MCRTSLGMGPQKMVIIQYSPYNKYAQLTVAFGTIFRWLFKILPLLAIDDMVVTQSLCRDRGLTLRTDEQPTTRETMRKREREVEKEGMLIVHEVF